jgi:hypothetical protein
VHLYNLNLLIWNHVSIVFQDKVIWGLEKL